MKYDYDTTVSAKGSICGFCKLEDDRQINGIAYPKGTPIYLIEFNDGSSIEVPESLLSAVTDSSSAETNG